MLFHLFQVFIFVLCYSTCSRFLCLSCSVLFSMCLCLCCFGLCFLCQCVCAVLVCVLFHLFQVCVFVLFCSVFYVCVFVLFCSVFYVCVFVLFCSVFYVSVFVLFCSLFSMSVCLCCFVPCFARPPRERKVPGSNPACARIFSGSSHTSDLKIGTPVAALPGAWRYRVSTGTGRPSISILWLGEVKSLICKVLLSQCGST